MFINLRQDDVPIISTRSQPDGTYLLYPVEPGEYTVSPYKDNYSFTPSERTVTVTNSDVANVDFTARPAPTPTPTPAATPSPTPVGTPTPVRPPTATPTATGGFDIDVD